MEFYLGNFMRHLTRVRNLDSRRFQPSQCSLRVALPLIQRTGNVLPEHTRWSFLHDRTSRPSALGWGDSANCVIAEKYVDWLSRLSRLTGWTFAFYLVANANFRVRMISVYLANTQATQIKIKIEPSFTQCIRATLAWPKTPNDYDPFSLGQGGSHSRSPKT